jgi:L-lysine 6-transaminase
MSSVRLAPSGVLDALRRRMQVDGLDLVLDLERSHGCRLVDARDGRELLDFFTFFASNPLGMNHPALTEPGTYEQLARVAVNKPSNSDVYTETYAEFVEAVDRVARHESMRWFFFVDGGALAVENALKVAFDWKVRKNLAAGKGEKGSKIIHFREAFHGRGGYTLSLTNTADPRKHQ